MTSVLGWFIAAPFKLLSMLVAVIVAPFVSAYSIALDVDRLPGWLAWMQTTDNSLDALWQQPQHLSGYAHLGQFNEQDFQRSQFLRWWARTLWLARNPAAGLSDMLGYESAGQPVRILARRGDWDSGRTNWLVHTWPGAWQIKAQLFYRASGKHFLRINLGWKSVSNRTRLIMTIHVNPFRTWKEGA